MPNILMTTNYGGNVLTDRRFKPVDQASPITAAEFAATQDMTKLDAYLAAANAAYWTATRLAQESWWDKLHWVRCQTPAGLP